LPGVGRRVYPLCRAYPRLAHDLEAEALAGLVQAIGAWPCGRDRVASRLVWAAARAAHRLLRRELTVAEREASVGLELEAPARPAVHGELVLHQAVAGGVVSPVDAELITAEAALAGWLVEQGDVPPARPGVGWWGEASEQSAMGEAVALRVRCCAASLGHRRCDHPDPPPRVPGQILVRMAFVHHGHGR
jgi:hypothetical protein